MIRVCKICAIAILILSLLTAGIVSCYAKDVKPELSVEIDDSGEPGFGIYLADTGELVLSEQHIKAYRRNIHLTVAGEDTHAIELNAEGIEKWNSYMTYEGTPKLKDTLYKRDFVVKVEGKEIYGGKFYSGLSSATYDGVIILDTIMKLDEEHNRIFITNGYFEKPPASEEDPRNDPAVIDFLDKQGLLK
jgi:hypothetical protein